METKLLEVRDSCTKIPAVAIMLSEADGYLAESAGFGSPCLLLIHIANGKCTSDAYGWPNRTMRISHLHIEQNWDALKNEDIVDVEFILGESTRKKCSDRYYPTEYEEVTVETKEEGK